MASPTNIPISSSDINALSSIHSLVEAFRAFDSNSDGLITTQQLRGIMSSLGYSSDETAEDAVEMMMKHGDGEGNGMLSVEEFLAMTAQGLDAGGLAGLLRSVFPLLAANGEDKEAVTAEELYEVLSCMERISMEDCMNIIASLDGDGDGAVCIDDLKLVVQALS